ncbi:kinase-like protein [Amniculicola lignicola CBS 123094]|uniref:Kinase-like protein n=1 Tax=Amniculicola lignicola CBS 123094 TaxID=1392246 RepID=A0A6A5VTB6_9PLEO|nr:kinase-like protein [Amniculicola lignicola CBS 123094]
MANAANESVQRQTGPGGHKQGNSLLGESIYDTATAANAEGGGLSIESDGITPSPHSLPIVGMSGDASPGSVQQRPDGTSSTREPLIKKKFSMMDYVGKNKKKRLNVSDFVDFGKSPLTASRNLERENLDETSSQSKSEKLARECGWDHEHQVFSTLQQNLLSVISSLGQGSLGVVEQVQVSPEHTCFVRKRFQLPYSGRKKRLHIAQEEAATLKRLDHEHIIKIIGTYEEGPPNGRGFYSLLIYPVGDHDLKTRLEMLEDVINDRNKDPQGLHRERQLLRKWFRCLASALEYMHSQGVRHQDIKPSNIICRNEDIYFTDFSSAAYFNVGRTTSTENPARTSAMYAAPEAVITNGSILKHGRGTDVFSLGCVFCEMLAVINGSSVHIFTEYLLNNDDSGQGSHPAEYLVYRRSTSNIASFYAESQIYVNVIHDMLAMNRDERPTAGTVATNTKLHIPYDVDALGSCSCEPHTLVHEGLLESLSSLAQVQDPRHRDIMEVLSDSMANTMATTAAALAQGEVDRQTAAQMDLDPRRKMLQDAMNKTIINGGNSFKAAAGA